MEVLDEKGDLIAWLSDDMEDWGNNPQFHFDMIKGRVSAFASNAIRAGYLANPEMRRSNRGKSRGDFRRNREDYSQYKCSIAVVYNPQHTSPVWPEIFKTIGVALNSQSYWIKEVISLPMCRVNGKVPYRAKESPVYLAPVTVSDYEPITEQEALAALQDEPLIVIEVSDGQILLKSKDAQMIIHY